MTDLFTNEAVVAFIQVVVIDLVLAGDNAVVIGLAAAGLPSEQRTRAILIGIVGATILRIVLAGLTTQLLQIVGLLFAGGILVFIFAFTELGVPLIFDYSRVTSVLRIAWRPAKMRRIRT